MADQRTTGPRPVFGSDAVFNGLANSGFDFLRRAIAEVSSDPRLAVVHFATAIELLLKARLMREHWALIVRNSGDADRDSFVRGEAKTVTADEAIRRLEKIAGLIIPADAALEFRKITAHRNRVVHFYHGSGTTDGGTAERDRVLREQHRGWFYLSSLLEEWTQHFSEYASQIRSVKSEMKQHAEFLAVVYDNLRPQIATRTAAGEEFVACDGCGHPSACRSTLSTNTAVLNCLVCGIADSLITFDCTNSECGETVEVRGNHPGQRSCPVCRTFYDNAELGGVLETDYIDPVDYVSRNCAMCVTLDSVVQNDQMYVCTECLTVDDAIYHCEWCNEYQMGGGELENSYYSGCEFCEGKAGWDRD